MALVIAYPAEGQPAEKCCRPAIGTATHRPTLRVGCGDEKNPPTRTRRKNRKIRTRLSVFQLFNRVDHIFPYQPDTNLDRFFLFVFIQIQMRF
jgi:hypothetical protein